MTTTLHSFQSEEDQKLREKFASWIVLFRSKDEALPIVSKDIFDTIHSRDQRLLEQFVRETKVEERDMEDIELENVIDRRRVGDFRVGYNDALSEVSAAQTAFITN